jgi:hypothetical protein
MTEARCLPRFRGLPPKPSDKGGGAPRPPESPASRTLRQETPGDGQLIGFDPDHPYPIVWKVQLEQAFGTVEPAFAELLLSQLIEAIRTRSGGMT